MKHKGVYLSVFITSLVMILTTLVQSYLLVIPVGIFLGTYGLCGWHEIIHKFQLYNISIFWKEHKKHHNPKTDTEYPMRKKYPLPVYGAARLMHYIKNFQNWSIFDIAILMLGLAIPTFGLTCLVAVFVAENIGFLQHTYDDSAVDFTNKFDNYIGCNFGNHAEHHGKTSEYKVDTQVWHGLISMYIWILLVTLLAPILKLYQGKANNPGVYMYGFFQNVANYISLNGRDLYPLLWRSASIFDKPKILNQYILILFGSLKVPSHSTSSVRNIYLQGVAVDPDSVIITHNGYVIEGHHRVEAKGLDYFNRIVESEEVDFNET